MWKYLKASSQCVKVIKGENQVPGMITRTFTFKTKYDLLQLYKSLVGPHSEYCMQVWSPYLKKDIDLLKELSREL